MFLYELCVLSNSASRAGSDQLGAHLSRLGGVFKPFAHIVFFMVFFLAHMKRAIRSSNALALAQQLALATILFEIAAAVDEEPGEPGEVVDGGTKK